MEDERDSRPFIIRQLELDPAARRVIAGGRESKLDPRSLTVLMTLMERFGRTVDKDELLRVAWPSQVVHENSLAKAISRLRRAIIGSGLEIAVLYGEGYTLRALPAQRTDVPANAGGPTTLASRPSIFRKPEIYLGVLAALALLGAFVFLQQDVTPIRSAPPTTNDPTDAKAAILWVDDHPTNNQLEISLFRKQRIAVHLAETTEDALDLLAINSYQLVVSDLGRGEDRLAGLKLISDMKRRGIAVPVLIYTMRPKQYQGQVAQRRLVAEAGASDLAVTPHEVRSKVLGRLQPVRSPEQALAQSTS